MSHLTLLEDGKILDAENITKFQFTDRSQLRQALNLADGVNQDSNKYLALLGDVVIKLVLVKEGLHRHATRGQINNIISQKASNSYLAQRGFSTGLAECIYKNRSQGNTIYPGPMASTVEAIIAAVFNDSGENITTVEGVMAALDISWPE
ncbi:hypothetical protein SI65_09175 [Aspergillus cristatus]|uniref:RNase III domain-containing protein n=1 Tax=Aspergillus cristatus TaxID=573508 RepID=A0A1E3B2T5_ASPCR|nr:hypothetical protein SI65_09175 [Aspergillus cristatus]